MMALRTHLLLFVAVAVILQPHAGHALSPAVEVAGAGLAAATKSGLALVGFTENGIAKHSLAAAIQSAVYGAHTTGVFSFLTSIAMTGATAILQVLLGAAFAGGVVVGMAASALAE